MVAYQGNIYQIRKKVCEVLDVLQLINSLVYYHSNQSHRHQYISLHNFKIYIHDIEIITAEFICEIFTMLWNKTVRNSRSRIVDLNEKTEVLLTAQQNYKITQFHCTTIWWINYLYVCYGQKTKMTTIFLPSITYNIHENDFSRLR